MKFRREDTDRHDPAEDWGRPRPMGWLGRSPTAIVTHGCPIAQDDHLIGLQSAVARCFRVLLSFDMSGLRRPRLRIQHFAKPTSLLRQLF